MSTAKQDTESGKMYLLYIALAVAGLWIIWQILKLLYYSFSYLAWNLFLGLDLSVYGRLAPVGWVGYAFLGLGLGAAGGAVAAKRRFRLNKLIPIGAGALVMVLCSFVFLNNAAHFAPPMVEAEKYVNSEGRGQCPACSSIEASSTKADSTRNRYTTASLLDKNPTTAWISGDAVNQSLKLTVTIPADHRLIGLRLGNGYGKSEEVFSSFSRVRTCHISLSNGVETYVTLPDSHSEDLFIPFEPQTSTTPLTIVFNIDETYAGENHPEVALSALTPVIAASVIETGSQQKMTTQEVVKDKIEAPTAPEKSTVATDEPLGNLAVVKSRKAYFYTSADLSQVRKSYCVRGDKLTLSVITGNAIYVTYTSPASGKAVSGWFKKDNLSIQAAMSSNAKAIADDSTVETDEQAPHTNN